MGKFLQALDEILDGPGSDWDKMEAFSDLIWHLNHAKPRGEHQEGAYIRTSKRDYEAIRDLPPEDREFVLQSIVQAFDKLTRRQTECLLLSVWGFNQERIGKILGIGQRSVSQHLDYAHRRIAKAAQELREQMP